jgi:hypothetical protein
MSEYGHTAMRGKAFFADGWGAGPHILTASGKTFYFEDSARFGPAPLDAKGEPTEPFYFDERSPFWTVWRRWVDEGRRTTEGKKTGFLYCVVSNGRRPKVSTP